jgi:two-component system, cell cycle sensor histidine kinase and response regulator CckA
MAGSDEGFADLLRRVLNKGEAEDSTVTGELWGAPLDSAWKASVSPTFGLDGNVVGAVVKILRLASAVGSGTGPAGESLSQRSPAQVGLGRLHSFLDSVVENVPAMIFVKDAENLRFEYINRCGEELIGLTRHELIGKSDFDFFPDEQARFFQFRDRETLHAGIVVDIPEEPIRTGRGLRWLHTKKIPIRDAYDTPKYLLGISLDITERKHAQEELRLAHEELEQRIKERTMQLVDANIELEREIAERRRFEAALRRSEEQLRHAQKMEAVGRLAGGVAHDFNNLLSVILSNAALLSDELEHDSPLREDLEQVRLAADRAAALTHQLLAFSRQQVLQPRPLDLNQVAADVNKLLRRVIGEDVKVVMALEPSLRRVNADPGQMEQVVMNLAINARDAMPSGGALTLQTGNVDFDTSYAQSHPGVMPGPHVMLAVSDTGTGMDSETVNRIFEPFFTTKETGKGTGLGLSTVYGIVKQSGGHIFVYSEVDRGTTFKIYLPELVEHVELSLPRTLKPPSGGGETILLVEDDDQVRRVAHGILRRKGYTVLEARSGAEAVTICEQFAQRLDLMITDVIMPGMNGRELADRARGLRPEMKILFMSGYTDSAIMQHGVLEAVHEFLHKPFTPDTLGRKVRELLDRAPGAAI